MTETRIRVGIDVGGTFTDVAALLPDGQVLFFKLPSTPNDQKQASLSGLRRLKQLGWNPTTLIHGTTLATNAVIQGRFGRALLVTTEGFGDVLAIGRQQREEIYSIDQPGRSPPLIPKARRFEFRERMTASGTPLVEPRNSDIDRLIDKIRKENFDAVAICFLHAYSNPVHEQIVRDAIRGLVPYVCASSDLNAEFREYERTSTTALNAILMPVVSFYADELSQGIERECLTERFHLVSSNAGAYTVSMARERPLGLLMSGPAAGVAASRRLAVEHGLRNAVTLDVGGTTTDVCFIRDGEAEITHSRQLAGHPVRLASVAVESVGAGGGSIAYVDAAGALKVGPKSAGAHPGPCCYGLGGEQPTVTDAHLMLGYLDPNRKLGGEIRLQSELAREALCGLSERFDMSVEELAEGILRIAETNIYGALRLVALRRGYNLEDCTLVAYGGMGPLHAGRIARGFGFKRIIVPFGSSNFSAFGCLISDVRFESVRTSRAYLDELGSDWLQPVVAPLVEVTAGRLVEEGYEEAEIELHPSLDCRYVGQNYEIEVPLPSIDDFDAATVRREFDRIHNQVYSYSTDEKVECINLRLAATVSESRGVLPELKRDGIVEPIGWRRASFAETSELDLPMYDRGTLPPEQQILGPAVVEDDWSTTLVLAGQSLHSDQYGNLLIQVKG